MEPSRESLEARIEDLVVRLERLERRVGLLETSPGRRTIGHEPEEGADEALAEIASAVRPGDVLALVGRTVMVLAGAYLLRAITELGIVPQAVGSALGLLYAAAFVVLADRAAARGRAASAAAHGLAASLIGFPVIAEATTRFHLLPPAGGAVALLALTAAALAVAGRRRLQGLAWIASLFAIGTAIGLAVASHGPAPYTAALLGLGAVTFGLARARGYQALETFVAAVAGGAVALVTLLLVFGPAERVEALIAPGVVLGLQAALVLLYLGGAVGCAFASRGSDSLAVLANGAAATVVGLGGAVIVAWSHPRMAVAVGVGSLVLAVASYAASFTRIDRREGGRAGFIVHTTTALAAALVAVPLLVRGGARAATFAVLAAVLAALGARTERATLSGHGVAFALAAVEASGLARLAVRAFSGTPTPAELAIPAAALAALAAALVCCALPVAGHGRTWGKLSSLPKLVALSLGALGLGGVVVATAIRGLATSDPAVLAVLRTAVLSVAAVGLALLGRHARFREAAWLVYPVLVLGAVKILGEDLRIGRTLALVASFALYGSALILAPRFARARPATPEKVDPTET